MNYLRIIHRILAPGGVWINLGMESMSSMSRSSVDSESQSGPLLWHFEENTTSDPSIELDLEEVKTLAAHIGFEIKVSISCPSFVSHGFHLLTLCKNERTIDTTYVNNKYSMLGYIYHAAFWTATKKV